MRIGIIKVYIIELSGREKRGLRRLKHDEGRINEGREGLQKRLKAGVFVQHR